MLLLPITEKGILLEKHMEIYLFGEGKGILSRDLEIAICSAKPVVPTPHPHLLSWRQLLGMWLPSPPTEEADAVCHPGLVKTSWPFPNAGPCSRSTCPAACLSLSAGSASWSNQRWSLEGEFFSLKLSCFRQFVPRSISITNYKPMRVGNNNSLGQWGNIWNKCPVMLAILLHLDYLWVFHIPVMTSFKFGPLASFQFCCQ